MHVDANKKITCLPLNALRNILWQNNESNSMLWEALVIQEEYSLMSVKSDRNDW